MSVIELRCSCARSRTATVPVRRGGSKGGASTGCAEERHSCRLSESADGLGDRLAFRKLKRLKPRARAYGNFRMDE